MENGASHRPAFSDEEITASFLAALDDFQRKQHDGPLTQYALTAKMGVSSGSMSQWKGGKGQKTNVRASTLVSAIFQLDLKLILADRMIGLCDQETIPHTPAQESIPEQLDLFLDCQLTDNPSETQTHPIELDKAEDVVLRITVRRALPPVASTRRRTA